jgi:hypothetical protein
MQSAQVLRNKLDGIEGKDYGACQSLKGEYAYPDVELLIAADPRAVKVRAYSGRFVASVDISVFIDYLPFK